MSYLIQRQRPFNCYRIVRLTLSWSQVNRLSLSIWEHEKITKSVFHCEQELRKLLIFCENLFLSLKMWGLLILHQWVQFKIKYLRVQGKDSDRIHDRIWLKICIFHNLWYCLPQPQNFQYNEELPEFPCFKLYIHRSSFSENQWRYPK